MRVGRYIVYGAGGIGASLGAQLHQAGRDVVLIARGAQRVAIAEKGLEFVTPERRVRLALPVVGHPDEIDFRPGDVAVLAMKTQDSLPAVEALAAVAGPDLPVLCGQNGVENERLVLRRFRAVIGLAVWIPASFIDPGVVMSYAPHAPIELGCVPSGIDERTRAVAQDLRAAGFAAEAREDVLAWKHAKLLTNAVSTLDAVCGGRAGLDDVCARIKAEGMACYRTAGIAVVPAAEYEARVAFAVAAMGEIDGRPRSGGSSTQSLARGQGSIETDYVNGEIVWLGRQHGVATPVNEAIQRAANELASRRRDRPLSADELRARIDALARPT
jgi:2-dehydropantoate 2-reductase